MDFFESINRELIVLKRIGVLFVGVQGVGQHAPSFEQQFMVADFVRYRQSQTRQLDSVMRVPATRLASVEAFFSNTVPDFSKQLPALVRGYGADALPSGFIFLIQ